ncbi:MAG TPA: glycosyltransferase [Nevskiaceae bacterium]|nr:glycosyltransferase [Nevskiaceae bacterium]
MSNAFWWLRVYIAGKHRNYTQPYIGTYAVIVPVFREDAVLFEKVIRSIVTHGRPAEFIITIDDASHALEADKQLARRYATRVIEMPARVGKREQFYQAAQTLDPAIDIVITVDSDTYWDETTPNILKPFNNPLIGAVSGCQTIFGYEQNMIRHAAEWLEDLRFRVTLAFQSHFGQVNVIPGRALAIRSELFKQIVKDTRHETVLGRPIITSDDASITMGVIERGYRTVYQSDSLVYTDAPNTFPCFWRQYLRWYRGSARRFFYKFPMLVRMHPLVFLANVEFLFGTFLYGAIVLTFLFKCAFRLYAIEPTAVLSGSAPLVLCAAGFFVSSAIRNAPHLAHYKKDIWFLPTFALFTFVTMLPLKLAAYFSFFENGWMTRRHHTGPVKEKRVFLTRTVAAASTTVVVALILPIPYLADIQPRHIPFEVIVRNQGPEYYQARHLIASRQATDSRAVDQLVGHYALQQNLQLDDHTKLQAVACTQAQLVAATDSAGHLPPLALLANCITPHPPTGHTPLFLPERTYWY